MEAQPAGFSYTEGLGTLIQLGGPVALVLLVMSILGLAVVLYKLLMFRDYSSRSFDELDRALDILMESEVNEDVLSPHNSEAAPAKKQLLDKCIQQLSVNANPCAKVLIKGIQLTEHPANKHEHVQQELIRLGNKRMVRVNSLLSLPEQIAYLAPLLGLLGTVLGIIGVFQGLASAGNLAGGNAGSMAGGIWEALLTTAIGMAIAIPFAIISALMNNRARYIHHRLQDLLSRLFTLHLTC